jgi:prepilin-type N-terminal cleavage/methylation domain-containing protein
MNQRPPRKRTQAGFTMIEVMVAILLTAIATSGIIGLYIVETRASGFSRHSTEATVLAQDQIEILRTAKFIGGPITTPNLDEHGRTGGMFTRIYTATAGSGPSQPYDDLLVQVQWTEDGVTRAVILRSRRNQ